MTYNRKKTGSFLRKLCRILPLAPTRLCFAIACLFAPFPGLALETVDSLNSSILVFTLVLMVIIVGGGVIVLLLHHLDSSSFRKLHASLTYMPIAVAIIRRKDGALLYGNKSCRELLGVRKLDGRYLYPDEISPQMMVDFLRPFPFRRGFRNVSEELHLARGRTLRLMVSGQPVRYKWQSAWLLFIVKPQKLTSTAKLEQEQRVFQQVLNSLSELVYFQDKAGHIIGTNRAFDRFWRGRVSEGVMDDEDNVNTTNTSSHTWTTAPDGSSRLLETNKTLLIGDNGEAIGTLSISHDVTDWHEMQESLKLEIEKREITEQALAQRNTLLDTIMSASTDPIGLYNEHGIYVGCNEPFARSLGFRQEELLGKAASEVLEPDKWELFQETDQQVIRDGVALKMDDYVILEDGTPVWYEVVKSPYRDPTDGTAGVLMMARDVTERKMAEQQLADAIMELQEMSFVDSLTKVANRRSFDEQLRKLWHSHIREQKPLTLILCDIDNFKAFNDNYGHQQGDCALREVAKVFRSVVKRETDEVARYGGEEFAFLLPNTDIKGGEVVAEKVHQRMAEKEITHLYSDVDTKLTVSLGVATIIPLPTQDYGDLVEMADVALYKAKAAGRNCTMSMSDSDC
ncbi:diguanylate cyclase domain-containing protein [Photobacterium sp. OFAV2-7]|uniref:diguanylate cyclase domain-containing protein n=1 Tax=Photobacterium sp. OFAV2-7 TaxID=2917748 RepID=UPI001EF4FA04|nr:diguanylate cyclase [Photobacterium sp. OFAV2-7]MCG7586063.1 diguanylate cyclase [Photobacterium sp. OFAV2-7]